MKVSLQNLSIATLLMLSFSACILDDNPLVADFGNSNSSCITLPPPPGFFGWETVHPRYIDLEFSINPNNPDDIVIHRRNKQNVTDTIFRHNLATHDHQAILTGLAGWPKWGKKDWILVPWGGLWKVKANGDSLQSLPCSSICGDPEWNPNGNMFFYQATGAPTQYPIMTLEGDITDTIHQIRPWQWFADDTIMGIWSISATSFAIYEYAIPTKEKTLLLTFPDDSLSNSTGLRDLQMFPDHQRLALLHQNGLYIWSKSTQTSRQIFKSCDNGRIEIMRISPDGNYILAFLQRYDQIDDKRIKSTTYTIKLNPETGDVIDTVFRSPID